MYSKNNGSKGKSVGVTATKNLLDTAAASGRFTIFTRAVEQAGLGETLRGPGPFTIFAPTDSAFEQLPPGKLDSLMKDENRKELASVLNYHMITGRKTAAEIGHWDSARTMHGQSAQFKMTGREVTIDGAQITTADLAASNGFLHGIDKVNEPQPPMAPAPEVKPTPAIAAVPAARAVPTAVVPKAK